MPTDKNRSNKRSFLIAVTLVACTCGLAKKLHAQTNQYDGYWELSFIPIPSRNSPESEPCIDDYRVRNVKVSEGRLSGTFEYFLDNTIYYDEYDISATVNPDGSFDGFLTEFSTGQQADIGGSMNSQGTGEVSAFWGNCGVVSVPMRRNVDADEDGMPDGFELEYGFNPDDEADAILDADSDGLSNVEEFQNSTNPTLNDTDSDGLPDGDEVNTYSTSPINPDSDDDGLADGDEVNTYGTSPINPDSDGDSISDYDELNVYGTDPTQADTDGDGVYDQWDSAPLNSEDGLDTKLDINDNDLQDWVMSGIQNGLNKTILVDTLNGRLTREMTLPSWFTPTNAQEIKDLNGNGEWDVLTLGSTTAGAQTWMLHDGDTGALLHTHNYPGWLRASTQKNVAILDDVNNNKRSEILLLLGRTDGRDALALYDGGTRQLLKALVLPGWFNAQNLLPMSDWTGNGVQEVLVYGQTSGGNTIWLKYDPFTGANLGQGRYPGWFVAEKAYVGPDFNNNGTESIITLGRTTGGARLWLAQDGRSGVTTKSLGYPGWLTPHELTTIDDPNGDAKADIITLAQTTKGYWLWRRTNSQNNGIQRQQSYPGWFTPSTLHTIGDVNSNGEPELTTFGENPSNEPMWLKADGMIGTNLGAFKPPAGVNISQ
jgi:hypothetical protein